MTHRALSTIISASLLVGLAACGGSSDSGANPPTAPAPPTSPAPTQQAATIDATPALAFTPSSVTVATGGTVTFAFGSVGHSVQFDSGPTPPANIPGTNADTSVARTFSTAGTYKFHCTIHPTMLGTVTVLAAASSTDY